MGTSELLESRKNVSNTALLSQVREQMKIDNEKLSWCWIPFSTPTSILQKLTIFHYLETETAVSQQKKQHYQITDTNR